MLIKKWQNQTTGSDEQGRRGSIGCSKILAQPQKIALANRQGAVLDHGRRWLVAIIGDSRKTIIGDSRKNSRKTPKPGLLARFADVSLHCF